MQTAICRSPLGNNQPTIRRLRLLAAVGILLLLTISAPGCKKSGGTVRVHGRVSFQDQPLANASLTFFPKSGRPVSAPVDQGQYATELVPGEYRATVSLAVELPKGYKEGDPLPPAKVVLPEAYTVENKSTLKATVKPEQNEPIDFDLK